ncbi:MAG: MBL fold metallo-hydrolase [Acidobacteria bacterium]|nr:MBL fold metallo-hydrolase [Acidobacteriota bacterium]
MNQKSAVPKDAAAVILLNHAGDRVLWAQRNPQLAFLGGYHAFPGGKLETSDQLVKIKNCTNADELARFIACAAREAFEEVGVLLVRNGEKLTKGQRASLHDDLISNRMTFAEILEHWNLWIDAADFFYTGFWTTPKFSPVRFKTRFFLAVCPSKQEPYAAISELQNVEFIRPNDALNEWKNSKVLIAPPVLLSLKTLAENLTADEHGFTQVKYDSKTKDQKQKTITKNLLENSQAADGHIRYMEFNPRVTCFPLKTETLPPTTHTNCFIVGHKKFVLIDAASTDESEQNALHALVDSFIEKDFSCRAIITTHLHRDHFGGETILQKYLKDKFGLSIPIAAHWLTAESLTGKVEFQKFIADGEAFDLQDETGADFQLLTIHTPGHARGLLVFYDAEFGFLLSGDNVVGSGSVVIAPPEGNMKDYLNSLERLKNLPNLRFLCGSHGAAVSDAKGKIESYIAHRLEREWKILEAFENGAKTPRQIVRRVYTDISPALYELAEKSVAAHLEKLYEEERISREQTRTNTKKKSII